MRKEKIEILLKSLAVILSYFVYTKVVTSILNLVFNGHFTDNYFYSFIADLIYFIIILAIYHKDLWNNIIDLKKEPVKKLLNGIKWMVIAVVLQVVTINILNAIGPYTAGNDEAVASLPAYYMIFKTIFFSILVEEIIFRKSIRDVIDNKILFIILSSLFYGFMNIVYSDLSGLNILSILPYFVSSLALSYLYVKYDNIVLVMLVKFLYNLIPLAVTLLGL